MKKLNKIEISKEEQATLKAGQKVMEAIWQRFREANGGEYGEDLSMELQIARDWSNKGNAWWTIHPSSEFLQTGHNTDLVKAFAEMHGHTEAAVKRKQAERYRREAEKLEREAKECVAA